MALSAAAPLSSTSGGGTRVSRVSPVLLEENKDSTVGVSVSLHPLPILSISEHLTRIAMQAGSVDVEVQGALLGTQSGREIEIQNTFEFPVQGGSVDHEYLKARQEQCAVKQVFPTFEFLGWYSVGPIPLPEDMNIHRQLCEYNESPLFLQLSPDQSSMSSSRSAGELPISVYETYVEMADTLSNKTQGPTMLFRPANYHVETGEAERIAVHHTSKPPETEGDAQSTLIANLTTKYNAIKMLSDRINLLLQYIRSVQAQKVPRDEEMLRQISSLVSGLPAAGDVEEFRQEFLTEFNDLLLTTYLSNLTTGINSLNELVDMFDTAQAGNEETSGGQRGRGGPRARTRALNV